MTETPVKRFPLGMPKGSVRALIALSIFGTVMFMLLQDRNIDMSLWLVNYVILGYYFASRQNHVPGAGGVASTDATPLHLPRGTVRWLIVLGFFGAAGYLFWSWSQSDKPMVQRAAFYPLLSLASFFLGRIFQYFTSGVSGDTGFFRIFQDFKAFFGLLSAAAVILFALLDIDISGKEAIQRMALVFIVFYFGSR